MAWAGLAWNFSADAGRLSELQRVARLSPACHEAVAPDCTRAHPCFEGSG